MRLSRIPILLIAGFPGFRHKLWMIDWDTDYWQGVYQFKDAETIQKYKKSFVLGLMNKRSMDNTTTYKIIPNKHINEYIQTLLCD